MRLISSVPMPYIADEVQIPISVDFGTYSGLLVFEADTEFAYAATLNNLSRFLNSHDNALDQALPPDSQYQPLANPPVSPTPVNE